MSLTNVAQAIGPGLRDAEQMVYDSLDVRQKPRP